MERTQNGGGALPFSREEAELLIPVVRARIEIRAEQRRRRRMSELRRAAFAFNLFPRTRRAPGENGDESAKDRLEDIGDHLRLAMLEYAAGRFQ